MLFRTFLVISLIAAIFSIRSHKHGNKNKDKFKDHSSKNSNREIRTEIRTFRNVCQHYGGGVCDYVFGIGEKCCKGGCDHFGCEHDTLSISNMNWNY